MSGVGWSDFVGILGVVGYIGAYFALQAGIIRGQGYLYAGLNAGSATLILLSLSQDFNLASAAVQIAFIAVSIFGMVRVFVKNKRIVFGEEENALIAVIAPNLSALEARRLIDIGLWDTLQPGALLTEEAVPADHLWFLADGAATVTVDGKTVARIASGNLVGEISCLTGLPASATVTVTDKARVFSIRVDRLNAFLKRNAVIRHELQARFARQIGEKLVRTNQAMTAREAG